MCCRSAPVGDESDDENDDAEPGDANERHAAVSFSDAVEFRDTWRVSGGEWLPGLWLAVPPG